MDWTYDRLHNRKIVCNILKSPKKKKKIYIKVLIGLNR